jgi:uncharacterized protein (DUF2147 family)
MQKFLILPLFLLLTSSAFAQDANKILGTWLTQEGDSRVEITKNSHGKFDGKIIWLKEPNRENGKAKLDDKNPDTKLQLRPIMGLQILEGFIYNNSDKEWVNGTIYDPKSGNTYKCLMWFDGDGKTLNVKGYVGVSLIGRKVKWTKIK